MLTSDPQLRGPDGKFTVKSKLEWKENLRIAAKRRKRSPEPVNCSAEGRRVVEIAKLAEEMWCKFCQIPLSFRFVEKEEKFGFASIFTLRCHVCLQVHSVHTSKFHRNSETGRKVYDVNVKGALSAIDGGVGPTQLNTIISCLNIPSVSTTLFKRSERYIGNAIEEAAKDSCREALRLEKKLTNAEVHSSRVDKSKRDEETERIELESPTELKVAYDAGWQRKGSGRAYNSLTAHGVGIGAKTKKVLAYATRSKRCIFCEKGHDRSDHDCRLNHEGSSKSMEPAMAVEIVTRNSMLAEENVRVTTIIGDDDSSTIAQVQREADYPVSKESDKNHATCNLSKALWSLKIPAKTIDYLKYCFGCVLEKNKGDVNAVRSGLLNIVPHAFDDHSNCGTWCHYHDDPLNYKHKILPEGKGLTNATHKTSLTELFRKFAANAEKLAPCGSTQGCESFHNIVASKQPKSHHYGGSESHDFRTASAVCQKNSGTSYVLNVMSKVSLSPGKNTESFRRRKDESREKRARVAKTAAFKRRRRELLNRGRKKNWNAENKEGISYFSGCGLDVFVALSETVPNSTSSQHEDSVPSDCAIVFFDVETTGLAKSSDIIQISARSGDKEFNAYVLPSHGVSAGASAVTGLRVQNGELYMHGQRLETAPRRIAINNFIDFLQPGPVILIAHNGNRFDFPMLLAEVSDLGLMDEFRAVVYGFMDTLPFLKKKLPERLQAKKSFRQSILAEDLMGADAAIGAHNAIADTRMLERILQHIGVTDSELRSYAVTVHAKIIADNANAKIKVNRSTLECLRSTVSAGMLTKMAQTGITLNQLKKTYADGGEGGIKMLLGVDVNGRPRVTKNKKVLQGIVEALKCV